MTAIIHGPDDGDGATLVGLARVIQPFAVVSFANLSSSEAALRAAGVQLIQGIDFEAIRIDSDWMSDAAELQLTHLKDRRHHTVAFAHPASAGLRELAERKREITSARAQQLGLTLTSTVTVGQDRSDTARRVKRWRSENPQVTAVVCFNDDVGLAILAALSDNAIAVPHEIAVIGTDDAPSAQYSIPAMTTLRSDVIAGAAQLARAVVCALNGEKPPLIPPHTFTIVERDST